MRSWALHALLGTDGRFMRCHRPGPKHGEAIRRRIGASRARSRAARGNRRVLRTKKKRRPRRVQKSGHPSNMATAAGGAGCPPPPPPNNNNNNNKSKSPRNGGRRRRNRRQSRNSDSDPELQGATADPSFFLDEDCLEYLPEKFDGNPDALTPFIAQCQVFMEKSSRDFSVDRTRVCFVTSMLHGRAARWATAKLERCNYLMNNYRAFMLELKHVFEDPQRREAAKRKIRRLRQGAGTVSEYAGIFQSVAQDLDWDESSLVDQFLEGLNQQIHQELSRRSEEFTVGKLPGPAVEGRAATGPERTRSPTPEAPTSHLQVMLQIHIPGRNTLFVRAMIDSGASGNFIDQEYVIQNAIPLRIKEWPIMVEAIDGHPIASGPIVLETHHLIVDLGDHREILSFDVTQSPFFPIVLGVRWLSTHDPHITWSTRSIVFNSDYCRFYCRMYSQIPPPMLLPVPHPPHLPFFYHVDGYRVYQPVRYYYVQNVYTPVDEHAYPGHRLVDPHIEMIPGAHSLPSGHVYSLSESEMAALRDFVDRNVKNGLMTPTVAPNGAQVLQVKRGWKLQVTYNCRAPHNCTVQNQYHRMSLPNMEDQAHLATYGEFVPHGHGGYHHHHHHPHHPHAPAYATFAGHHLMFAWYPVGRDVHGRVIFMPFVVTWCPHGYHHHPLPVPHYQIDNREHRVGEAGAVMKDHLRKRSVCRNRTTYSAGEGTRI
ncbi:paternally expressed 10 [Cricetulus griseus]